MKYRIVTDQQRGFGVEYKLWWWPFWISTVYSFYSVEEARTIITRQQDQQPFTKRVVD